MWMLLHGFTGSPQSWAEVVARGAFAPEPCIPTLAGHGLEWRGERLESFESEVKRLGSMAASLDAPRLIAGYSLGARVALGMLATHPNLFDAAVLIGVHPGLTDDEARAERRRLDEERAHLLRTDGLVTFVEQWEDQPLFETQRALPEERRRAQRRIRLQNDSEGLARSLEVLGLGSMPDYSAALRSSRVPITLMSGARDAKFCRLAAELASESANVESIVVDGAGHNLLLEARDAVVTALTRVEASVEGTPR